MQIGRQSRIGFSRIDNNDFHLGIFFLVLFQSPEKNGMAPGRIGSRNQESVCQFNIVIRDGHRIFTEGFFVTRHGRTHAQTGIGIYIIGFQKTFDQFVDQIIFFGKALTRNIETHAVRTVFFDYGRKHGCGTIESRVPAHTLHGMRFAPSHFWIQNPVGSVVGNIMKIHSFRTKHSPIHGMVFVSGYRNSVFSIISYYYSAPYTTIGTRRFDF